MNKKKIAFTIIVAVIALSALCWVFWLVFYFDSTIDGSIVVDLTNEYILFERNYCSLTRKMQKIDTQNTKNLLYVKKAS